MQAELHQQAAKKMAVDRIVLSSPRPRHSVAGCPPMTVHQCLKLQIVLRSRHLAAQLWGSPVVAEILSERGLLKPRPLNQISKCQNSARLIHLLAVVWKCCFLQAAGNSLGDSHTACFLMKLLAVLVDRCHSAASEIDPRPHAAPPIAAAVLKASERCRMGWKILRDLYSVHSLLRSAYLDPLH